ncbi:MAG TPA: GxxExxY protein [Anaerolineales bacterium]|nr:GxxExxY protein [Anaerolineales bacterium]
MKASELLYKEEVYEIVGAAMEVHRQLGCGFLEPVYQEAIEIELMNHGIPFIAQKDLLILYENKPLKKSYIADLVIYESIIVEIKAISHLTSIDEAQLLNYLKATGLRVGVLINFGSNSLEWKRMIR